MPDWLAMTAALLLILFISGLAIWRVRYVIAPRLGEEDLDEKGEWLLRSWREQAPDPNSDIPMDAAAWASYGLSQLEAIDLARYLASRGQISLPGYGFLDLMMGQSPRVGRLTQNSWERFGRDHGAVTVNGPASFGDGVQINSGTFTYEWHEVERDLVALSFEVQYLAQLLDGDDRDRVARAGDVIDEVIESGSTRDSRLGPVLRWLSTFATDTTSAALGGTVATLASGILASLGVSIGG